MTTPRTLKTLRALGWALAALLGIVVALGAAQHRDAVKTLGVDAAPSVVAAHNIKIHIQTLDADLVNDLLVAPGSSSAYVKDFDANRVEIGKQVIAAAKNITYGDAELVPIEKIQDSLGRYLMAAQTAREAHDRGDQPAALAAYRATYRILETELVPAADDLNTANDGVLQDTYDTQRGAARRTSVITFLLVASLVLLLVATQVFVARRFHRRVNPGIAAATVVALGFGAYTCHAFGAHARDLKGAKLDAYDSVQALLATRAEAYEANAAESRWLLDRSERAVHERRFVEFVGKLATFSGGQTFATVHAIALARNADLAARLTHGEDAVSAGEAARTARPLAGMTGSLQRALDNVTFPSPDPVADEPTQAAETLRAFGVYHALDAKLRELENAGDHAEAVRFCVSMKPGESNWAFFQFDAALGRWLAINEGRMQRYTAAGFADVALLPYLALAMALAIAALLAFGFQARLREYVG
jgi:hypothetical protein